MFLLRSAFWLTLAFMIIRPEIDMGETTASLSGEAMTRGSHFIAQQIDAIECSDLTCLGGKALASAALQTAPLAVVETQSNRSGVPLPRPRPDRLI
jgi:hypothetical protein